MILEDWRGLPAPALAELYAAERARALHTLQWDYAPIWQEVEQARTTWGLPGFVARDDRGRLCGMVFYVVEGGRLDVGGIAADDGAATATLLDGVLGAATVHGSSAVRMLVFEAAAALRPTLEARGFTVESHFYLSRRLPVADLPSPPAPNGTRAPAFDSWRPGDTRLAATLLRRAYEPAAGAMFAPSNDPAEWERYVSNVVAHPGCGRLSPAATVVMRDRGELRALAMITDIAPRAAHIVQLAVDPAHRRRHLGRALVNEVCGRLTARGYRTVTLLVAASNAGARALYAGAGFRQDATFVGASREA